MATYEENNRYTRKKWIIDEEHIIFGPRRVYKPITLRIIAITIMALSFTLVVLVGSKVISIDNLSSTFIMVVLFVFFLYGMQLNSIVRDAVPLLKERQEEIEKARRYAEDRKKHGK